MTTATKSTTNLQVICPECLNPEAEVKLNLSDMPTCECSECGETFTPEQAVEKMVRMAERWERVARWIKAAPEAE